MSADDDFEVLRRVNRTRQTHPLLPTGQIQEQKLVPTVRLQEGQAQPIKQETRRYPYRVRRRPDYFGEYVTETSDDQVQMTTDYCYRLVSNVPLTFSEAMTSPNSRDCSRAMDEEMESLNDNKTFTLSTLPEGKKAVGGRWVYALKTNADGSDKFRARYVAKGYSQKQGVDYDETFSPTANLKSIRVLMQKAAQKNLILHQMDVKTAYLRAPIDCDIYMTQPEGYEITSEKGEMLVCKLEKYLYGLKQSGRNWNRMLHDYLCGNLFTQNPADHCVYTRETKGQKVIIVIWVDDLVIAASDDNVLRNVKEMLTAKFQMKDLGKLKSFLGIDFQQSDHCVKMSQERYVGKILDRFDMQDCKPRATPCEPKLNYTNSAEVMSDVRKYREAVGSLVYLSTCTRPDLSYVVSKLSQYLSEPTIEQWTTVKHVLRYLKGTKGKLLCYRKSDDGLALGLEAFSDANWAEHETDRRSTTGYCVSLNRNGPLITWKSKRQSTVALSTCEAEYMALAATVQECMYLIQLLKGVDGSHYMQPQIYEDNQGAIALAKNPAQRQRCKHVDIKYHFVRSAVTDGKVILNYCPTEQMVADIMTKPPTKSKLKRFQVFMFGE